MVLRRMFGPKRNEVAVGWRRLHNEELRIQVIRAIKFKQVVMGGACSTRGRD